MAWYNKWAILVIAAAIGLAGYNGIPWCKMGVAEWAYWVQAIGSIVAISGAFFLGDRQARSSVRLVVYADRVTAIRKAKAILAVTNAAQAHTSRAMKAFDSDGFSYIALACNYEDTTMQSLIQALADIPAHEVGSYNAVAAILRIRTAMGNFHTHVHKCLTQAKESRDPESGAMKDAQLFNTVPINMCMDDIIKCNKILAQEVELIEIT